MNGQQRAVLWIGLILVGLNLVSHWKEIAGVIFTGAGILGGFPGTGSGNGGLHIGPDIPFVPPIQIPGTPIHILSHRTKNTQVV